jgi:hypothetical protein
MYKMIYIFGDSHANFNFRNLKYTNCNKYENSITLHRIGRDKLNIIDFKTHNIKDNDVVVYQFGEVDCRCHIGRQILLNRDLNEIITELVDNYIDSIKINMHNYNNVKIIICSIPPTMDRVYYESKYGPITHEFPFIGTNEERIYYTNLMNQYLKESCANNQYIFFDYHNLYSINGLLNIELSDDICHIKENTKLLDELYKILHLRTFKMGQKSVYNIIKIT